MRPLADSIWHTLECDQILMVRCGRWCWRSIGIIVVGTITGLSVTNCGGGSIVYPLEYNARSYIVVAFLLTAICTFQWLSASWLVLVIRVVLLMLYSQSLCFINKWTLFFLIQQPVKTQLKMLIHKHNFISSYKYLKF